MFNKGSPSERNSNSKRRWFSAPFHAFERCEDLDKWSKNSNSAEKLNDGYLQENAEEFLLDFQSMVLKHCQPKWRRAALGADKSTAEVLGSNFYFNPKGFDIKEAKEHGVKDNDLEQIKTYHEQYVKALLYFCREILSPVLVKRVLRLKESKEAQNLTVAWKDVTNLIKKQMKAPDATFLIRELVCKKREDHETLLDWSQNIASYCTQLKKVGVTFPDSVWVEWVWAQVSPVERRIVEKKTSIQDLEDDIAQLTLSDLPKYKASMCAKAVARIPSLPSSIQKESKAGKSTKSQNDAINSEAPKMNSSKVKRCGYCKVKNPDHEFNDCPKLLKRKAREQKTNELKSPPNGNGSPKSEEKHFRGSPSRTAKIKGERKRRGLCITCGNAGHYANDCPQKAKGFIGAIEINEEAPLAPIGSHPTPKEGRFNFQHSRCERNFHSRHKRDHLWTPGPRSIKKKGVSVRNPQNFQFPHFKPKLKNEAKINQNPNLRKDSKKCVAPQREHKKNSKGNLIQHLQRKGPKAELYPVADSKGKIMKAKVKFVVEGETRIGVVGLDTCCSHTIIARYVADTIERRSPGPVAAVCGGETSLGSACSFVMVGPHGKQFGPVDANLGHNGKNGLLPRGCVALFSRHLCSQLGVDLHWHLDFLDQDQRPECPWIRFRKKKTTPPKMAQIHLAEAKVREFLNRKKSSGKVPGPKREPFEEVIINVEKLTPGTVQSLRDANRRYKHLFVDDDTLPPPLNCEPHVFKLKPGAKPFHCPEPRWTPAKAELIDAFGDEGLKSGLLEPAPMSAWANRLHDALKPGKSEDDWGIRLCVDAVQTNERIIKVAPMVPNLKGLVMSFGKKKYFYETDAPKSYNLIILDAGSRDLTTFWTRKHGKLRYTRLIWGFTNAGTVLQHQITKILSTLPKHHRDEIANYVDDFAGGVNTEQELVDSWCAFLEMASQHNLSLKASKTKLGFETATFGGYEIGGGMRSLAEKHLAPLARMKPPTDVSSLRTVLGLLVQSMGGIEKYSIHAKPLTRLTGKVPWKWGEEEQKAFEYLKAQALERHKLYNPDWARRIHVNVDASDLGWGAVLYQLSNEDAAGEVCTDPKAENMQVILYLSEAFDRTMLRRPTYYKEGFGLIKALGKVRFYIEHSPHRTAVHTDHFPHKWMKHSQRGMIVGWRVAELAGLTYDIYYLPGPKNIIADALSRYPLISMTQLTVKGLDAIFDRLLQSVPESWKTKDQLWVWAERDTQVIARSVQHWRVKKNAILKKSPKESMYESGWDAAILAPSAERAPQVCARLFNIGRPFACLVTSDLVDWISVDSDSKIDSGLKERVAQAPKISFLSAGFTWVLQVDEPMERCQIYAVEDGPPEVGSHDDWKEDTKKQKAALLKQSEHCSMGSDGLIVYACVGDLVRIVVPFGRRQPLVMLTHVNMSHRGWRKVLASLRKGYFWKNMSKEVKEFVLQCTDCIEVKGKLNKAHGLFSARNYDAPRVYWAIDYILVAPSADGFLYLLTAMDLFTNLLLLIPTKTREAQEAVLMILRKIIFRFGVMSVIVSDEEKSFNGRLLSGLEKALGIRHISTAPYDARGNAQLEASHGYVNQCLTLLTDGERDHWNEFSSQWEFAYATVKHRTTGFSPFELCYGTAARTVSDAVSMAAPTKISLSEERVAGLYSKILENAALFHEVAKANAQRAREDELKRLNASGTKTTFQVGDHVAFFLPSRADTRTWRLKHCRVFTGPAVVVEKHNAVIYEIEELKTAKRFVRSVTHLRSWTAPVEVLAKHDQLGSHGPARATNASNSEFVVGSTVAIMDESDKDCYWFADVKEIHGDDSALVHMRGTKSPNPKTAVFKLVWIEVPSGLSILADRLTKRLLSPGCTGEAWTGKVSKEEVIIFNAAFTKAGRMAALTRRAMSKHLHKILQ
jgi:hypothetical protein